MAGNPRQDLYLKISQNLTDRELTDLRTYVSGAEILSAGFVEKAPNAHQICNQLEKEQQLKSGDLSLLADLLRRIGRHDYAEKAEKIAEKERKELDEKPKSTASWRRQPIASTASCLKRKRSKSEEMPSPMLMAISETPRTADSHNPLSEEHTRNPKFLTSLKRDLANEDLSIEERLKIWKLKKELEEKELDTIYKHQEKEVKSLKEAQTFLSRESLETMYKEIRAKVEEERAKVVRAYEDCLILFLDFETKSDFEHFWGSYISGRLSDTLSQVTITDEMMRLDNGDKLVHVMRTVVLKEDFRAWRDFFSKGLDHTTSADNLLALPPPARHVDCSSLSGLDLAVVARENQPSADGTGDISRLNFTVREVQKAIQSCKEKAEQQVRQRDVQLEAIRGQVRAVREDTEAMARSQTQEITRLRTENEKAQKIILEQKLEMQQLQESSKAREAEIEELKAKNTKLSNQVANIPELRDEVRKFREKDESSQKEIQQLQESSKAREAEIEELKAKNTKLSNQVGQSPPAFQLKRKVPPVKLPAGTEQQAPGDQGQAGDKDVMTSNQVMEKILELEHAMFSEEELNDPVQNEKAQKVMMANRDFLLEFSKLRESQMAEVENEDTTQSRPVAEGHDQLQTLKGKEETSEEDISEATETETQHLHLETTKGKTAAQVDDPLTAKETVESKSQREELRQGKTQSRPKDKGVERYFSFIKKRVSSDWKDLAWHLKLGTPDIDNIDGKHRDDKSRCKDLLQQWHKREGNAATIHVLMEALQDAELQHVVDSLKVKYPELNEKAKSAASRHQGAMASTAGSSKQKEGKAEEVADLPVSLRLHLGMEEQAPGQGQVRYTIEERLWELERTLFTVDVFRDPVRYREMRKLFLSHMAVLKDVLSG